MELDLVNFVNESVDPKKYYQACYPDWEGHHNANVSCPFKSKHSGGDARPSFSICIEGNGGAYCHACGTKIASIVHHEKLVEKLPTDEDAATSIYSKFVHKVMKDGEKSLSVYKTRLTDTRRKIVESDLGISADTIDAFQLGWNDRLNRMTIPIIDSFDQVINIRHYTLPSLRDPDGKYPKMLNEKGYGQPAAIFGQVQLNYAFSLPEENRPRVIYWMTGERDTLLGWDQGIPCFCVTTGERVWKEDWTAYVKSLNVTVGIISPNEKDGRIGAKMRFDKLTEAGVKCFLLDVPKPHKDFSDFVLAGGDPGEFVTNKPSQGTDDSEAPARGEDGYHSIPDIYDPTQGKVSGIYQVADIGRNPLLINSKIEVHAVVSGRMDRTFAVPCEFLLAGRRYRIPISRELVSLCRMSDERIEAQLRKWVGSKSKQPIEFVDHKTITEIEIIPMVEPGVDSHYVSQRCFFIGDLIECNKPYLMGVIPTTSCDTQETLGLIYEIRHVSNAIDDYKLTPDAISRFRKYFHSEARTPEGVLLDLKKLAGSVSENHSLVYTRDDLHQVTLLTWLSPLQFNFFGEGIQRGWLNTLVVGDTETGKSKVCQKLTSLFNCGAFITAESCTYVGLVGGAVKSSNGMFMLRWGKIPLYNRQLVILEEMSGLHTSDISKMSEIRSSGYARLDKGGLSGATDAKTRLICLSNVRGESKSLADYPNGVTAVQALVGQNEDVARFDLILTVTDDEVSKEIINKDRTNEQEIRYDEETRKAFKEFVTWVWSLTPDKIDFTVPAYQECLLQTLHLSEIYHPSIPLFKSGSGRLKIARIACAIAASQFSWNDTTNKLTITALHVKAAGLLLHKMYRKPSLGYAAYSQVQYSLEKINVTDMIVTRIKTALGASYEKALAFMVNEGSFNKQDLIDILAINFFYIERAISAMFEANLIKREKSTGHGAMRWYPTKGGKKWMEKEIKSHE